MQVIALYRTLIGAQVRAQLQYRASFGLQLASQFLGNIETFISVLVIFNRFPELRGWTLAEVAFIYGLSSLSFGLADMLVGGFDKLSASIQTGEFDRVLTRPAGSFLQTLAADFQLRRLGRAGQGLLVFLLATGRLEIDWTPERVLVTAGAVLSGVIIFGAVFVIGAAVTFWTVQTSEVTNVFTYGGQELSSWPLPVYAAPLRRLFTFLVPLAFVTYLPVLYVLGKPDPLGLPPVLQYCSLLVAGVFMLVARAAWDVGVGHYQSTGS